MATNAEKRLFEVAVLRRTDDDTEMIVEPRHVLARNRDEVRDRILIEIGQDHVDHLDQLEVMIRPFS